MMHAITYSAGDLNQKGDDATDHGEVNMIWRAAPMRSGLALRVVSFISCRAETIVLSQRLARGNRTECPRASSSAFARRT